MDFSSQLLKSAALITLSGGTVAVLALAMHRTECAVRARYHALCDVSVPGKEEGAYEYKYVDEYQERYEAQQSSGRAAESDSESDSDERTALKERLSGKRIRETTPRGDVIMHYDVGSSSFIYYCDDRQVPYKYLETVARKYVLDNDCLEVYVNMYEELKKGIERQKDAKVQNCLDRRGKVVGSPAKKAESNGVFAVFRNYNKTNPKEIVRQRKYITKDRANRYSLRGGIEDAEALDGAPPPDEGDHTPRPMSFAEFKKLQETARGDDLPIRTLEDWVGSGGGETTVKEGELAKLLGEVTPCGTST